MSTACESMSISYMLGYRIGGAHEVIITNVELTPLAIRIISRDVVPHTIEFASGGRPTLGPDHVSRVRLLGMAYRLTVDYQHVTYCQELTYGDSYSHVRENQGQTRDNTYGYKHMKSRSVCSSLCSFETMVRP